MTTIPKDQLIAEMQVMGERLSELAKTFSEDVHLSIGAFSDGYIRIITSVFEDDDDGKVKVDAMPIRRYYSTVNQKWEEDEEDAYPEIDQAPED